MGKEEYKECTNRVHGCRDRGNLSYCGLDWMEAISGYDSGSRGIWMCFDHFWSRKELKLRSAACQSTNRAALGLLCVLRVFVFWTAVHRQCVCGCVFIALCLFLECAACRCVAVKYLIFSP